MTVACGLSVVATVIGSVPAAWAASRSPKQLQNMAYGASLYRSVILAFLAAPTLYLGSLHRKSFLLWLGISYLVALGAETVVLALLIRRTEAIR